MTFSKRLSIFALPEWHKEKQSSIRYVSRTLSEHQKSARAFQHPALIMPSIRLIGYGVGIVGGCDTYHASKG